MISKTRLTRVEFRMCRLKRILNSETCSRRVKFKLCRSKGFLNSEGCITHAATNFPASQIRVWDGRRIRIRVTPVIGEAYLYDGWPSLKKYICTFRVTAVIGQAYLYFSMDGRHSKSTSVLSGIFPLVTANMHTHTHTHNYNTAYTVGIHRTCE